jgi:uncharacterized protein (DUF2236 family)
MRTATLARSSSRRPSAVARRLRADPWRPRLLVDHLPPGTPGDPGLWGPGSEVWRVWRERTLLLGGPAAVLLQLAHPLITAGVAAHSNFRADPLRRLRAVLDATLTVTFGDRQQAAAAAARVARIHRGVQGRLPVAVGCFPAGTPYRAGDPRLALWVHATLVVVALEVIDQFVSPLTTQQRARYYQESRPFAVLFGVTERLLPGSYPEFDAYVHHTLRGPELAIQEPAPELAAAVLDGWLRGLPRPPACVVRMLTAGLLPERVREGFGLPWGRRERQHYAALRRVLHATVPCLPPTLRFWPHYHVALRRVAAAPNTVGAGQ